MGADLLYSEAVRTAAKDATTTFVRDLATMYGNRELDDHEKYLAGWISNTRIAAEALDRSNPARQPLIDAAHDNLDLLMAAVDQRIQDGAHRAARAALSSFIQTALPIIVKAAAAAAL